MVDSVRKYFRLAKNFVNKYDPVEVRVREATSNDPWGPSALTLSQLAQDTYHPVSYHSLLHMLWKRVSDYEYIKHILKGLRVVEYLLKHGSPRFVDDVMVRKETLIQLQQYTFWEDGVDMGDEVRRKATEVLSLLDDPAILETIRQEAQAEIKKNFGERNESKMLGLGYYNDPKSSSYQRRNSTGRRRDFDLEDSDDEKAVDRKPLTGGRRASEPINNRNANRAVRKTRDPTPSESTDVDEDFEEFDNEFKDPCESSPEKQAAPSHQGAQSSTAAKPASPVKVAAKATVDDLFASEFGNVDFGAQQQQMTFAKPRGSPVDLLAKPEQSSWLFDSFEAQKAQKTPEAKLDDMLDFFGPNPAASQSQQPRFNPDDPWGMALEFTSVDDIMASKAAQKKVEEHKMKKEQAKSQPKLSEISKFNQSTALVMYEPHNQQSSYVPPYYGGNYYAQFPNPAVASGYHYQPSNALVLYGSAPSQQYGGNPFENPSVAAANLRWN